MVVGVTEWDEFGQLLRVKIPGVHPPRRAPVSSIAYNLVVS